MGAFLTFFALFLAQLWSDLDDSTTDGIGLMRASRLCAQRCDLVEFWAQGKRCVISYCFHRFVSLISLQPLLLSTRSLHHWIQLKNPIQIVPSLGLNDGYLSLRQRHHCEHQHQFSPASSYVSLLFSIIFCSPRSYLSTNILGESIAFVIVEF